MDCFKQRGIIGLATAALALGQVESAHGIEPEDVLAPIVGPVVVLPHVSLSERYDDNVFLLSDDLGKVDDLVTTLSPGVGLQFGDNILDSNYIGLDYTLSQNWYAENSEINSANHALTFAINYQKEGKYRITGTDSIRWDNSILSGRERSIALADRKRLVERVYFSDRYRVDYILSPKTSLYASAGYNASDYSEEPHYYYTDVFGGKTPYALYDVSSVRGALGFGWQAFPKIKMFGGGFYGQTTVGKNISRMSQRPDSDFGGFFVEADGDFREKLTGRARVGYQVREFDRLANGGGGGSHGMPVFQVSLEYEFTAKRTGTFTYLREGRVSVESPDWGYAADMVSIVLNQEIGTEGKLAADASVMYELDDYESLDGRQYKWLRANAGLTYRVNQWMNAQLSYSFDMFDSNKGNIDYNVNRVMLGLSVGY
ncbi:MAG: outer membrane beta-barrel protein [Verrucomicrobia bacterium]|nr:outer membrane beta-barrel protein [Verrucomicrobiota bacterium]